jgi:hypothetical protein
LAGWLQVEADITSIQAALDSRLNSLAPSARQAYNELLAEQDSLLAEATRFEEGIAELNATLAAAEGELGRNTFKQRALELQVREGAQGGRGAVRLGWAGLMGCHSGGRLC